MNRLKEFRSFLNLQKQMPDKPKKILFYDEIFEDLEHIERKISPTLKYKSIINLQENINKISEKVTKTLDVISLEGTRDEILHFEGVKSIIQLKIQNIKLKLEKLKLKSTSLNLDLNPEKPQNMLKIQKNVEFLEQENIAIMESSLNERYRQTRRRLLEIESIQENIGNYLNLQDERIDNIISNSGAIYESVEKSKSLIEKNESAGSFFRRFFIILMFCLTFMILFIHLFYK